MGAPGIRRRKRHRPLEPREALPPGDAQRVFGQFANGTYTPAGNLERNGFFWRQLSRRHRRDGWSVLSYGIWALAAFGILLAIAGPIVVGLWHVVH